MSFSTCESDHWWLDSVLFCSIMLAGAAQQRVLTDIESSFLKGLQHTGKTTGLGAD
jgi:hypothetical protein